MIAIYGTGEAARRLRYQCEDLGLLITFHIDRGKKGQGELCLGRRILSPAEAERVSEGIDYIVIGSMWRDDIAEWLEDFYPALSSKLISEESLGSIKILEDKLRAKPHFPSIVFLSHDKLSSWHGVGLGMERYLGWVPKHKWKNVYTQGHNVNSESNLKLANFLSVDEKEAKVSTWRGKPSDHTIIYSTAFSESELDSLRALAKQITPKPKVIQHFTDYLPRDEMKFLSTYRGIAALIDYHLVYDQTLYDYLSRKLPRISFELVTTLAQTPIYKCSKKKKPSPKKDFGDFVMIGNIWNTQLMDFIDSSWNELSRLRLTSPIHWYSHSTSYARLAAKRSTLPLSVSWEGFTDNLETTLQHYKCALVFVGNEKESKTNYERFSVPSRIIDFMKAGLPFITIGPVDSAAVRFCRYYGIGATVISTTPVAVAGEINKLMQNKKWKEESLNSTHEILKKNFTLSTLKFRSMLYMDWLFDEVVGLNSGLNLTSDSQISPGE